MRQTTPNNFSSNIKSKIIEEKLKKGESAIDLAIEKWTKIVNGDLPMSDGQEWSNCALCIKHKLKCHLCPLDCMEDNSNYQHFSYMQNQEHAKKVLDQLIGIRNAQC